MQNPKLLDPRRADRGADAAGGRPAVRRAASGSKSEGRAVLYIWHKLDEVKRLCDTATILRGGKKIATCDPREETAASLARMMVGADIGEVKAASGRAATMPRLVDQRSVAGARRSARRPSRNDLARGQRRRNPRHRRRRRQRPGRIVLGAVGRAAVAPHADSVIIDGHAAGHSIGDRAPPAGRRLRAGRAARPRHRAAHETVGKRAAHRPRRQRHGQARLRQQAGDAGRPSTRPPQTFDVRKAKRDPEAASLSGGNLQKFMVGREILREPGVLIVSQPTWGVDAGAAAVIRQALIDLAGARRRRAGDQPGPRRAGRDRRPHRRHVPRPRCRSRSMRPRPRARSSAC